MKNELFPTDVHKVVSDLGFFPVSFVELYTLWSVIGFREDGKNYNIQLSKKDLSVESVHLLTYQLNATGAKIMSVARTLIK